jgi:hypothetical protein
VAAGFYVACDPYLTISLDAANDDLGRAVRASLEGYRSEIARPSDWKQLRVSFVEGLGAKSHRQLQQYAINCRIVEWERELEFQPTHNGGTKGDSKGFQPISGTSFMVAAGATAAEIGTALVRGFDLCTTTYGQR